MAGRAVSGPPAGALDLAGHPPGDCPFANSGPEVLGAIPLDPVLVTLLAVAHQATTDQVFADCEPAVDLGHDVVKGRAAAQGIVAIGAAIVPGQMDLIAG